MQNINLHLNSTSLYHQVNVANAPHVQSSTLLSFWRNYFIRNPPHALYFDPFDVRDVKQNIKEAPILNRKCNHLFNKQLNHRTSNWTSGTEMKGLSFPAYLRYKWRWRSMPSKQGGIKEPWLKGQLTNTWCLTSKILNVIPHSP